MRFQQEASEGIGESFNIRHKKHFRKILSLIGKEALNRRKYKNSLNAKHFINFDFYQEVIYSLNIKAAKT